MEGYSIQSAISSLLLNMLNIVALFLILRALVYRPVRKYLQSRADRIKAEADKAQLERDEAEKLHGQYLAELAKAQQDAEKQAAEILDRAGEAARTIQSQSEAEAKDVLSRARQQAQHEHADAMRQLRREIADITVEVSSRVLGREVTEKDNADIIEEYFDLLKNKNGNGADA